MASNSDRNNVGPSNSTVIEHRSPLANQVFSKNVRQEMNSWDKGMEDYSKALQALVNKRAKPSKPKLLSKFKAIFQQQQERNSIDKLLKQWKSEPAGLTKETPLLKPATARLTPEPPINNSNASTLLTLRRIQNFPILIAVLVLGVMFLIDTLSPGAFLHGLFLSRSPIANLDSSARQLLIDFASPVSDDRLTQDIAGIDERKFQVLSFEEYVVQPNDTLSGIANKRNLNMDTLISFNELKNPRWLRNGQTIKVPNRNGLLHSVGKADSLEIIAKRYGVTTTAILDVNNMADETVVQGSKIFIPDVRMNPTDLKMLLGELFSWPASARFTSGYGYRRDPFTGRRALHNGIDLANVIGTPIYAALAGKVVLVENQIGGYGKVIIIQHARGFKTLYGHLNSFNVVVGQSVAQGQVIARMGNTGRSTGPHVHFSVNLNGVWVNPMLYLR